MSKIEKIKLSQDTFYEGEVKNGEANGKGKITFPDGSSLEGNFKNNINVGNVKVIYSNGDIYEGSWKNGVADGLGIIILPDGTKYEGEFKGGKNSGKGKRTWPDGSIHEGEYKNDNADGYGIETNADGSKYEGEFKRNIYHGNGTRTLSDGTSITANWVEGIANGKSKIILADGSKHEAVYRDGKIIELDGKSQVGETGKFENDRGYYEGELSEGIPHGYGTFTFKNDELLQETTKNIGVQGEGKMQYVGYWSKGVMHGKGTITYPNGDKYIGQYVNGVKEGFGKEINVNGSQYEGLWQDGLMHGDGIYILQDGSKYEGQFKEGKRDGEGRYTWVDGRKYEGQFKNDLIDGVGTMWNQKENINQSLLKEIRYMSKFNKIFFYPSSFDPHKNHKILFNSFNKLSYKSKNNIKLIVTINKKLVPQKYTDNQLIFFIGNQSINTINKIYKIVDFLIFPSLNESLGLPLIEASFYELPIISSNLDYVFDVCKPHYTFDPYSEEDIFNKVLESIN